MKIFDKSYFHLCLSGFMFTSRQVCSLHIVWWLLKWFIMAIYERSYLRKHSSPIKITLIKCGKHIWCILLVVILRHDLYRGTVQTIKITTLSMFHVSYTYIGLYIHRYFSFLEYPKDRLSYEGNKAMLVKKVVL